MNDIPVCGCGDCRQAFDTAMSIVCAEIRAEEQGGNCITWHQTVSAICELLRCRSRFVLSPLAEVPDHDAKMSNNFLKNRATVAAVICSLYGEELDAKLQEALGVRSAHN